MERSEQLSYTITDEGEEGEPSIRDGRGILQNIWIQHSQLGKKEKGKILKNIFAEQTIQRKRFPKFDDYSRTLFVFAICVGANNEG